MLDALDALDGLNAAIDRIDPIELADRIGLLDPIVQTELPSRFVPIESNLS